MPQPNAVRQITVKRSTEHSVTYSLWNELTHIKPGIILRNWHSFNVQTSSSTCMRDLQLQGVPNTLFLATMLFLFFCVHGHVCMHTYIYSSRLNHVSNREAKCDLVPSFIKISFGRTHV